VTTSGVSRHGVVQTVNGPVDQGDLGRTLAHEHVIADISALFVGPTGSHTVLEDARVDRVDTALLARDPLCCRDNLILRDVALATEELGLWRSAGGGTVVDCTSIGLGRDIALLSAVAVQSDVHIVAPTGFYLWDSCAEMIGDWSVDELYEFMAQEITQGIADSGVRAGVIGEIGTSTTLHDQERRVLSAAGALQRDLDVPIAVHVDQVGAEADAILDVLAASGADLTRVVLGHMDQRHHVDVDWLGRLADRGALLGFDTFGTTFAYDSVGSVDPTDDARVGVLARLVERGYAASCVLSHDVGMKSMLRAHGGGGYAHLALDLSVAFERAGVTQAHLDTMFGAAPQRWLGGKS
jgi:phosphotriesterase-related protein